MVETLKVGLGDRSYPLHIGAGVLDRLTADWSERLTPKRLSVVADARVWEAHGDAMAARLAAAGIELRLVTVPGGEESKTFPVFADVCEQLLADFHLTSQFTAKRETALATPLLPCS